jgi:uncharacterized membrane protein
MARLIYALIVGLVGAGIVHITILLMIPYYSERDAWALVSEAGPPYSVHQLRRDGPAARALANADPMFEIATCRFDLSDGSVHIFSEAVVPFWSLSVFDRRGQNVFSLSDRTATGKILDIVVATPVQLIELRKAMPPNYENAVFVEADITEGMIVLRSFVPDLSWLPLVERHLGGAQCETGAG